MKRSHNHHGQRLAIVTTITALTGILLAPSVFAVQPPQGHGGPGGFGGPGRLGGRRSGGPRPISVSMIPAKALAEALGLSSDQTTKITAIQDSVRAERQKLMPAPGVQPGGPPPDRETMQANREKMRTLDQKATGDIEAVLTTEQKSALPELLKILNALGRAGVPPEVAGDLKLTADQRRQLAALPGGPGGPPPSRDGMGQGRREADEKVMAILTADQKKIVEAYPRQGPGEGGGRPPRGGGFGPPPSEQF